MASKISDINEKKEKGVEKGAQPEESERNPGQRQEMDAEASTLKELIRNREDISPSIDFPQDEAGPSPGKGGALKDKGGFTKLKKRLSPKAASLVELNKESAFGAEDGLPSLELLRTGSCPY